MGGVMMAHVTNLGAASSHAPTCSSFGGNDACTCGQGC
jgi:hypothetical protein